MAPRARTLHRQAQLGFDALSIEGGLISPDWLARVAQLQADDQTGSHYRIPKGLNLRDEIGRYWRIAQALWSDFAAGRESRADSAGLAEHFVIALLAGAFGFISLEKAPPAKLGERLYPIGHRALGGRVPVVIALAGEGLDTPSPRYGDGGRRRTPFGLAQDCLNAAEDALWGIATDGLTLRILRDNASLTRPAWIEADLARIFTEERYADFAALWLLLHETRFGRADVPVEDCPLEAWRKAGREEGTRAREHLRKGVEEALEILGQGFLGHPDNAPLRQALQDGALSRHAYFQELLRLVYRLIFLLTIEERGLLHPSGSDELAKRLYAEGYSLRRLRERAARRSAHDRHADLWQGLKIVFRGLAAGEPRLGLPALGGLFAADQCPQLDAARLQNRDLLDALFRLAWLKEETGLARVNWRDMGPEELGSVYEGLLELTPQIVEGGRRFRFAEGAEAKGNLRKLTGSYYTPDSLVQALLDSALEPVIAERIAAHPEDPARALLDLAVVDPACGSGHFLLGAARRIAVHLARLQAGGTPSAAEYRKALRQVVGHCVFGVDRNPMALELARTALWLEAMTPDAPLTFIDHHLVCGDALIGLMDLAVLKDGIPSEAFKALAGDDAAVAKRLAKKNRDALKSLERTRAKTGQLGFAFIDQGVVKQLQGLDGLPDDTLEAIEAKRAALQRALAEARDPKAHPLALAADLHVAAFLMPKTKETEAAIPTTADLAALLDGQPTRAAVAEAARAAAARLPVLHWRLAFAQVFAKGGFDCVLGNPPWEVQQLDEEEFFASRDPEIAALAGEARKKAIAALETESPRLWAEFQKTAFLYASTNAFVRKGRRYPLTAVGKINTYPLFAETALGLAAPKGRAGMVLPSGIATDDSTSAFFAEISAGQLVSLIDFENREALFPGVHRSYKFCLLTLGTAPAARFSFFLTRPEQAKDARRQFSLSADDIRHLNPNTRTCATFRSERDAELTRKIYARVPVLWAEGREDGNPWGIEFRQGLFNMTSDSGLFHTAARRGELRDPVPLYEAKMIHQFDHRWATYMGAKDEASRDSTDTEKADPKFQVTPRYWVERAEVDQRLADKGWNRQWLMGWRDICRSTDERTVITSVFPRVACNHKIPIIFSKEPPRNLAALLANLLSMTLDYVARQKVGGTSLTFFYIKQFPVLPPSAYADSTRDFIATRVLELTYTAHDMRPWAEDLGFDGPPFAWNRERRAILRAELDAVFAALYGLDLDELRYILDPADVMGPDYPSETFRVLKEREIKEFGEYRTRRLVLEAWDRLEKAGALPAPFEARR
jgi:hypothetical protein